MTNPRVVLTHPESGSVVNTVIWGNGDIVDPMTGWTVPEGSLIQRGWDVQKAEPSEEQAPDPVAVLARAMSPGSWWEHSGPQYDAAKFDVMNRAKAALDALAAAGFAVLSESEVR